MRRLPLALASLLAASCAGKSKPPAQTVSPAAQAVKTGGVVPKGMEPQAGEQVTAYDLTHSGKPDAWKYTFKVGDQERVARKEKDLNGDGKVDVWELYGEDGSIVQVVYDLDFDGKPDETLFYEKDQLVKKELSFGFDGVPRTFAYYEKGKLVRKERDTTNSGKVNYWEYWEGNEIDRIGIDVDGDGQVDRWETRHSDEKEGGSTVPGVAPAAATGAAPASAPEKKPPAAEKKAAADAKPSKP